MRRLWLGSSQSRGDSVMGDWKVPLADVIVPEDDIEAVADTYRSGWLSMGPRVEELEDAFARYTGANHALAVSSGTAALHLIALAAGLGPRTKAVVPSLTFVAAINAVAYTGAVPLFGDIAAIDEPWLSAEATERLLAPDVRAIMTTAYGGHPGQTTKLAKLAESRGIALLEDSAHGLGSRVDGRHIGTFGVAGAYSFFSNKNLAIGEGGMVVTDDPAVAGDVRLLRSHGMTTMTWDRHRGHATTYDVVTRGFNYRLDEPRAALALKRLTRLDEENRRRSAIVSRYREAFSELHSVLMIADPPQQSNSANHLFVVVLDTVLDRDRFRAELADAGVQTSVHYPPVHRFSIYADRRPELPVTDSYAARAVTLPLFPHMSESQIELVIEVVSRAVSAA
jgi:dTDP-4-amino-4,6-dideoxygalactose transaminase